MTAEELIEKNIDLIDNNQWEDFYINECEGLNGSIIRRLHHMFYEAGIDPITEGNMQFIPRCYFSNNIKIDSYIIPNTVLKIKELAFCRAKIKKIKFTENSECYVIGQSAFEYSDLEEITLPKSLEYIEFGAFSHCEKLKKITYLGTTQEWLAKVKLSYGYDQLPVWISEDTPANIIYCSDGAVDIWS